MRHCSVCLCERNRRYGGEEKDVIYSFIVKFIRG